MFDPVAMKPIRAARRLAYLVAGLFLAVILAAWFYATPAHAIPGSTQNPDGSWTGPNGEDLGGGDPNYNPDPEPPKPEPKQSHEGEPTARINCGCGYMVILRDGQTRAQGLAACKATVQAQQCSWVGGVYPGDKG